MRFHMLFEQSGTFRDVFSKYGHDCKCYDIQNEYGKTDVRIDLFQEIEMQFSRLACKYQYNSLDFSNCGCIYCWRNKLKEQQCVTSIFEKMTPKKDFILAFFPCTYFSEMNELLFRGFQRQGKGEIKQNKDLKSIQKIIERNKKRSYFFEIWLKFCFVCQELKIPTIIENPCGAFGRNFLTLYSPYEVSFKDRDRSDFGDKYKKATYYFAINFEMKEKFEMFYDKNYELKSVHKVRGKERSEITPRYAENFYKRFLEGKV